MDVAPFWPTWPRWWVGDAVGVLVIAPAIFARRRPDLAHSSRVERWLLLTLLAIVTVAAVFPWQAAGWEFGLPYLLAPALVLVGMRVGPRTSAIALAVSATTANAVTAAGYGPFAVNADDGGVVVAQLCIAGGASRCSSSRRSTTTSST